MNNYDIVVAGGGPAGLQFARKVGKQTDYDILILEKDENLGDNIKSTGATFPRTVENFDLPDEVIQWETDKVVFEGPNTYENVPIENLTLDFPALQEFLGEEAKDAGVEILRNCEVERPLLEDGEVVGVECTHENETKSYHGKLVVDATGPHASLAEPLNMVQPEKKTTGLGYEYEATGTFPDDSFVIIRDEYAPGGYAWIWPAGENKAKIGVCWIKPLHKQRAPEEYQDKPEHYLEEFIDADDRWEVDDVLELHTGLVRTDGDSNDIMAGDGIIAIGDAVSTISPLLGEGVRPSMESANMAAETAIPALNVDDTSRKSLKSYEKEWRVEKGEKWKVQTQISELMYQANGDHQDVVVEGIARMTEMEKDKIKHYDFNLTNMMELFMSVDIDDFNWGNNKLEP